MNYKLKKLDIDLLHKHNEVNVNKSTKLINKNGMVEVTKIFGHNNELVLTRELCSIKESQGILEACLKDALLDLKEEAIGYLCY